MELPGYNLKGKFDYIFCKKCIDLTYVIKVYFKIVKQINCDLCFLIQSYKQIKQSLN